MRGISFPLNFYFGCYCMGVKEGVPDCMNRFSRKYPGYLRFFPHELLRGDRADNTTARKCFSRGSQGMKT